MMMSKAFDIISGVIKHRINKLDKSMMLLVIGEMGSGKSLAAVSFACKVDPTFKDHPRIVYDVNEFLEKLNDIEKGQAIIFDEVGVGVAARDFQKLSNKIMSIVTQILRYKNIFCIFTTPNARFMDINLRESMNGILHPIKIDPIHNINTCAYRILETNMDGLVYKKKFIYYDGKHGAAGEEMDPVHVPRPDKEMEAYYKRLSFKMKDSKLKELEAAMNEETPNGMVTQAIHNKAEACVNFINSMRLTSSMSWEQLATASGYDKKTLQRWIKESETAKRATKV